MVEERTGGPTRTPGAPPPGRGAQPPHGIPPLGGTPPPAGSTAGGPRFASDAPPLDGASLGAIVQQALQELKAMHGELLELSRLRLALARARFFRRGLQVVVFGWLGLLGATVTVVTGIYLVQGWLGALRALFAPQRWAGDLVGSLLLLAGAWAGLRLWRSARERSRVAKRLGEGLTRKPGTVPPRRAP